MNRRVIYTAIVGAKDIFHEPIHRLPDTDYICFTNTPNFISDIFTFRPLPFSETDPRATARKIKLYPHELFPYHEESLWIDGSQRIRANLLPLFNELATTSLAVLRHPSRDCLYEEAQACMRGNRSPTSELLAQVTAYQQAGMPSHHGLYETSILFRRHTTENARLMQAWWYELQTHSLRDQISLPYVLWKQKAAIHALDYRLWHDPYFLHYPHRWHPKNDDRNRLFVRLHAYLWLTVQRLGLQTQYEKAIKCAKQCSGRFFL